MQNHYDTTEADYLTDIRRQPVWVFALASFLTFGLYTIYWAYKHWRFFKERDDLDIMPVWRAIFAVFFTHALLERINDFAIEKGHAGINSDRHATGYVIALFVQNILARVMPDTSLLFMVVVPFVFLIPSVKQLNYSWEQTNPGQRSPTITTGEMAVLLIGGCFCLLIILGAMV